MKLILCNQRLYTVWLDRSTIKLPFLIFLSYIPGCTEGNNTKSFAWTKPQSFRECTNRQMRSSSSIISDYGDQYIYPWTTCDTVLQMYQCCPRTQWDKLSMLLDEWDRGWWLRVDTALPEVNAPASNITHSHQEPWINLPSSKKRYDRDWEIQYIVLQ